MRKKNPSYYTVFLRPTRLLISEKSPAYMIKWSYTIISQVRVIAIRIKVQVFCEGHKNLTQSSSCFWRYLVMSKPKGRLDQILVAFLEYLNFNYKQICLIAKTSFYKSNVSTLKKKKNLQIAQFLWQFKKARTAKKNLGYLAHIYVLVYCSNNMECCAWRFWKNSALLGGARLLDMRWAIHCVSFSFFRYFKSWAL